MAEQATKGRRPKRANGDGGGSIRPNGTWQWRVSLDDGHRTYGCGKTQAEAKRSCLGKVALAEQGVEPKAARQTVAAYLSWRLVDVVKPTAATKTHRTYRPDPAPHRARNRHG